MVFFLNNVDQTTLIAYLAILLGFVFIPGPAVLLTLARASTSGTSVGIATGLGIAIGDLLHTAMVIFGLSAIIMSSALVFSLIKYAGAAYLVYLGIRSFLEKANFGVGISANNITAFQAMRQAVLTEFLNPKSALFFLALLPQFVRPENGAVTLQLFTLGIFFVGMGLLSTVVVSICAGPLGAYIQRIPIILRWKDKFIGVIFLRIRTKVSAARTLRINNITRRGALPFRVRRLFYLGTLPKNYARHCTRKNYLSCAIFN